MKIPTLCLLAVLVNLSPTASAQHTNNYPHPPEPADSRVSSTKTKNPTPQLRLDPVQLQREAKELLELSQSLQPDIEYVTHGMLPKDMIEKLKRIEKLSKHLRSQLAP